MGEREREREKDRRSCNCNSKGISNWPLKSGGKDNLTEWETFLLLRLVFSFLDLQRRRKKMVEREKDRECRDRKG
jgi:hypothetical protein